MPLSTRERASRAGRALQASRSPEERREAMRKVRLAAAVKAIVEGAPDLRPDQAAQLRAIFGTAAGSAGQRAA